MEILCQRSMSAGTDTVSLIISAGDEVLPARTCRLCLPSSHVASAARPSPRAIREMERAEFLTELPVTPAMTIKTTMSARVTAQRQPHAILAKLY